jgi:hypothetical protein
MHVPLVRFAGLHSLAGLPWSAEGLNGDITMRLFVLGIMAAAIFAPAANAQIDFPLQAEGKLTAFFVKELIPQDDGLPVLKVRLVQVLMHNGTFDRELSTPLSESLRGPLLKKQFKLYRGPMKVGVYTYEVVPEEKKLKKGEDYLRAVPVDKDAALQVLTARNKDQAISESKLDEILNKAKADEIAALRMGRINSEPLLLIPVSTGK